MTQARLLYRAKKIYPDGSIKELVIWQLPQGTKERPHGLKYRLYYGTADGKCLVRYDNEKGKGDHRHVQGEETPYRFTDIETLVTDFQRDIDRVEEKDNEPTE